MPITGFLNEDVKLDATELNDIQRNWNILKYCFYRVEIRIVVKLYLNTPVQIHLFLFTIWKPSKQFFRQNNELTARL